MRPSVSVAMCTYNGLPYLKKQLQSLASQSLHPDELVICDDGSSDNTVNLLTAFATQAPFLVRLFFNEERLGPTKNFEKAIRLCKGEIIALADQDDIWKSQKIERLLEVFAQHPEAGYAFSDAEMVDAREVSLGFSHWDGLRFKNRTLKRFSGNSQLSVLLRGNVVTGASMAFRASLKGIILPISPYWMHDYWIAMLGSIFTHGVPIHERLFMYRQHSSQQVGWAKKTLLQQCEISLIVTQEDCGTKVDHFRELQERVLSIATAIECSTENINLLKQKEIYLSRRAVIRSAAGISRTLKVLAEAATGRYRRFSNSRWTILRDMCPQVLLSRLHALVTGFHR